MLVSALSVPTHAEPASGAHRTDECSSLGSFKCQPYSYEVYSPRSFRNVSIVSLIHFSNLEYGGSP